MNPRHRLVAWVRFLALTAAHPERAFEAATIGRAAFGVAPRGTTVSIVRLPRMAPEVALEHLASLAALFDDGMCEPLRLATADVGGPRRGRSGREGVGVRLAVHARGPGARAPAGLRRRADVCGIRSVPEFDRRARQLWDGPLGWEQVVFA